MKLAIKYLTFLMLCVLLVGSVSGFDLRDYPKPMFIDDSGVFSGILVVGKAAASSDVIGIADIKSALQKDSFEYHRNPITGLVTLDIKPISVAAVMLDSEVDDISKYAMIVVGGPCTNSVAASLLGFPESCVEGFEIGRAKIKIFDNFGKPAILVAGMTKRDTRRATTVLANYDQFDLKGDEIEVTSQTIKDITLS